MAASLYDSDSDSKYGWDLTAEEEEGLVGDLLATVCVPSPQAQTQTLALEPCPAPQPQHPAPFFFEGLTESDLHFDSSELDSISVSSHARKTGDPGRRPSPSEPNKRKLSPSVASDNTRLASFVARTVAKSTPVAVDGPGPDVVYPDLSRALSNLQDATIASPAPENNQPANQPTIDEDDKPPILRFRTFPRKPFSVSDLTAGAWCEQQYFYTLTRLPGGKKTRTTAMKGGTKIHEKLEAEVYTNVSVDVTKKEDAFGLKMWNVIQGLRTLRDTGLTRELEVWGILDGDGDGQDAVVVNGVIDFLSYENPEPGLEEEVLSSQEGRQGKKNKKDDQKPNRKITEFFSSPSKAAEPDRPSDHRQVYIMDVKTRGSTTFPSAVQERGTKVQLYFYHRFLSTMAADALFYPTLFARYGLRPDEPFSDAFVAQIGALHGEIFDSDSDDEWEHVPGAWSTSDYVTAPSKASVRYNTLFSLSALLRSELRTTFPRGAASLGQVVSVEYRYRPWRRPSVARAPTPSQMLNPLPEAQLFPAEEEDGMPAGAVIGTNTFFVDNNVLDGYVRRELEWWRGQRKPRGVKLEEAYKCRSCEFAGDCEWRVGMEAEVVRKGRASRSMGKVGMEAGTG